MVATDSLQSSHTVHFLACGDVSALIERERQMRRERQRRPYRTRRCSASRDSSQGVPPHRRCLSARWRRLPLCLWRRGDLPALHRSTLPARVGLSGGLSGRLPRAYRRRRRGDGARMDFAARRAAADQLAGADLAHRGRDLKGCEHSGHERLKLEDSHFPVIAHRVIRTRRSEYRLGHAR